MSDEAQTASIGSRILNGIAWKAASQVTVQVTRIVVALVLARHADTAGMGSRRDGPRLLRLRRRVHRQRTGHGPDSATGVARRRPLDRVLVQRRRRRPPAIVGIALAGPLASFYGESDVRWLFVALSCGFVVSALGTTQMALMAREMQFARLELRQIAATLTGAAVGIALAVTDRGAWAIVGQILAEATVSTLLLWVLSPWRPSFTFSTASLRRLGGFAGNVFAENVLWQAGRTVAGAMIGR